MKAFLLFAALSIAGLQSAAANEVFDGERLAQLDSDLETDVIEDVHAVLVDYRGKRVFEKYYSAPDSDWGQMLGEVRQDADRRHDLRSVSKSVAAIALGIALGDEWQTELERPLTRHFPEYEGRFGEGLERVSLHDALTMQAGLEWNEMTEPYGFPDGTSNSANDEIRLYRTTDPLGLVLARDVISEPGSEWYYNGGITQMIGSLVQAKARTPFLEFVEDRLFAPMGIEDYEWRKEERWSASTPPAVASGLRLKPSDLAKFGKLVRDRGMWNGKQIVPAGWVEAMTARHVSEIPWFNTTRMNSGYGYQWYRGTLDGQDLIFGVGNGDQGLMIFPKLDLIITIMAGNYDDFTQPTRELIAAAVLDALDPKVKQAALEAEIWRAVRARNDTWRTDDFDGHMALYHPDFRRWALHGDQMLDKPGFAELWKHFKSREDVLSIDLLTKELQWLVPGKAAVAHYRIDEKFVVDGTQRQGNLRFSDIFILHQGEWKYAGGHRDFMSFLPPE